MLDTKINSTGTILMHEGRIYVDGFNTNATSCRETAAHALLWAIGEMQRELAAMIEQPGGTGKVGIDLPKDVHYALGLPDPFALADA